MAEKRGAHVQRAVPTPWAEPGGGGEGGEAEQPMANRPPPPAIPGPGPWVAARMAERRSPRRAVRPHPAIPGPGLGTAMKVEEGGKKVGMEERRERMGTECVGE